jgi:CRP-like cAMP-binding protein
MADEPGLDLGVLVGCVIVDNGVDQLIDDVYLIQQGVASVLTDMSDGASIEVGMIGIEGMIGVAALLGATSSSHRTIVQIPGDALRMDATRCSSEARAFAGSLCDSPNPC